MPEDDPNANYSQNPSQGMDVNAYSHYYYSTYYPEYYAQLQTAALTNRISSTTGIVSQQSSTTAPSVSTINPAQGSRVAGEKAFRQMAHYFDYEAYNTTINQEFKEGKRVPLKLTRKEINVLKQRKLERKKKRMLDWLHND